MFEKHDGFSVDNYINTQGEETKKRMLDVIERDESVFNKFLKLETEREENKWNMPSPVVSYNKETNDYKRSGQSKEHEELFGFTQNMQKGEIKFVSMTPDKFLSLVPEDFEHSALEEWKLEPIREGFKKGNWMKTPFLELDVKNKRIKTHEGRHRAWVAKELGIKEIPVVYFTDGYIFDELDDETKQDITNGNLKRENYGNEAFVE
tara:strand:+ start:181 stop:798 length:618 start_codon:yes stop_codon:yes gene_type:complete